MQTMGGVFRQAAGLIKENFNEPENYTERSFISQTLVDFLQKKLPKEKTAPRILELAFGQGEIALNLAKNGYEVSVLDISKERIAELQSAAKAKGYIIDTTAVNTNDELPYPDNHFSAIIIAIVNMQVNDIDSFLNESLRILRKGGLLIMTVLPEGYVDTINNPWKQYEDGKHNNTLYFLADAMKEHGFTDIKWHTSGGFDGFSLSYMMKFWIGWAHEISIFTIHGQK